MFTKSITLLLSLVLLISTSCFADTVQVSTNEPESQYIDTKIDLLGRDFVERITIDRDNFLLVNQDLTDVRVKKDKKNGINKFYALVAYNLYVNNSKQSDIRFLYVQCPVTRSTYIDRSLPGRKQMINGEMRLVYDVNHDILKKDFLDLGSYSFLSSTEDKVSMLSNNFPMAGKVSQNYDIEVMCHHIISAHNAYLWSEVFRRITLKKFGISE